MKSIVVTIVTLIVLAVTAQLQAQIEPKVYPCKMINGLQKESITYIVKGIEVKLNPNEKIIIYLPKGDYPLIIKGNNWSRIDTMKITHEPHYYKIYSNLEMIFSTISLW